jgi:hypothetical protein
MGAHIVSTELEVHPNVFEDRRDTCVEAAAIAAE